MNIHKLVKNNWQNMRYVSLKLAPYCKDIKDEAFRLAESYAMVNMLGGLSGAMAQMCLAYFQFDDDYGSNATTPKGKRLNQAIADVRSKK